ncbi:hypothetical protein M407DRAFT_17611 [Tulasnella calospora MUT 4182]|uniref:DUF6533 domain-containing protein n=1 Tax=Tulasnella calospora MUT 4182 TaxID=1051891 RepID=A0A0C3QX96_9AGAM|nr:hypothetical protein M407DRAFT_17611 [Tulasnella calospora MUT 4182]
MAESLSTEELTHVVLEAMKGLITSRYVGVAGYTILIYDHILTFPIEVELVWRKPKGHVTYAFLFNRYLVPLVIAIGIFQMSGLGRNLPPAFCHAWLYVEGACMMLCYGIAHYMAALRVRALHSARPWVDRTLWTAGTLYALVTVSITLAILVNVAKSFTWDPTFNACNGTPTSYMHGSWIPGLFFESVLFALIILKAVRDWRKDLSFPITRLLYRDGFLYFGVMAGCSVFNIIASSALKSTYILLAKYFCFSLVTVMSSRIVLNLRTLRHGPSADPTSLTTDHAFELGGLSLAQSPRRSAFPGTYLSAQRNAAVRSNWSQSAPSSAWPLNDSKAGDDDSRLPSSVAVTIQVDVHRDVEVDEVDGDSADDSRWPRDEKKGVRI